MDRSMQAYVDHLDQVPVLILPCFIRYRTANPVEGASIYPACQNLLLAARAVGYGGVMTTWEFVRRRRAAHAPRHPRRSGHRRGHHRRSTPGSPRSRPSPAPLRTGLLRQLGTVGTLRRRPAGNPLHRSRTSLSRRTTTALRAALTESSHFRHGNHWFGWKAVDNPDMSHEEPRRVQESHCPDHHFRHLAGRYGRRRKRLCQRSCGLGQSGTTQCGTTRDGRIDTTGRPSSAPSVAAGPPSPDPASRCGHQCSGHRGDTPGSGDRIAVGEIDCRCGRPNTRSTRRRSWMPS